MAKSFEEFRQAFITEVEADRLEMGEGLRKSFVACLSRLVPDEEAENVHLVYLDEKFANRRVCVDGYAFNGEENTLLLVVADWNEFDSNSRLTKTEANTLLKRARFFFDQAKKGKLQDPVSGILEWSSPEYGLADLIYSENIERVRVLLYTDRLLSDKFKKLGNEPIGNIPVSEEVWGLERLYEYARSNQDHEPIEIDFSDAPIPLKLAAKGKGFKSYLGVISANKLAAIYQEHGGRLLEGNVRSYLTLRSPVNRDIRGTILRDPKYFFIYNNGIAVTAQELRINKEGELIQATNFQIINGGQTTASLARVAFTEKADLSQIQVAVKLTEIDNDLESSQRAELIRNISRYSNNQNKVSGADFSSNHPFHVTMEQCAMRLLAPPAPGHLHGSYWFYERNRGGYLQAQMFMTDAEQRKFEAKFNKKRVVKKEEFARARLLFNQLPDVVSKGAASLFSKFMDRLNQDWEEKNAKGVYGDAYFKDTIALIIMYNELRLQVRRLRTETGYLANIVAYTISVFFWMFERKFKKAQFDLDLLWKIQDVPGAIMNVLVQIYPEVVKCLVDPRRPVENVTEWAKRVACWESVKRHFEEIDFDTALFDEVWCRSQAKIKDMKDEGKEEAKARKSVDLFNFAFEYKHWNEALRFNSQGMYLTALQHRAITHCSQIAVGKLPKDKEIELALASLEILRKEGFQY